MFKKYSLVLIVSLLSFFLTPTNAYAVDNPLSRPNNKIGIHILFDTELPHAAKLVNANGGDWGYVTIPIQITDKNFSKWQKFMKTAKKHHVIPMIRLATEIDPTNTKAWRKATRTDIVEFANFLTLLDWPTTNKYIIIFNEVNRGDEWGGEVNPAEYADLLSFATTVFKSKNPDYFILNAGLDNAAPNQGSNYMNQYDFMKQMDLAVPGIFNQIDGLSSHSYPNPAFAQPPDVVSRMGIASFKHERDLAQSLSNKTLPVFITETGWSADTVPEEMRTQYYQEVFNSVWNDPSIVAITPFLLDARGGPFQKFSFLTGSGSATRQYEVLRDLLKIKGAPLQPAKVLAAETAKPKPVDKTPKKEETKFSLTLMIQNILQWMKGT